MKALTDYLQSNPKKHLIFDFDETICYIHPDWAKRKQLIHHYLLSFDPDIYENIDIAKSGAIWLASTEAIKKYGTNVRQTILQISREVESSKISPSEKHQSLIDFIAEHSCRYAMHIWSSNMTETFIPYLEKYNIIDCFATLVGQDTIELIKEYPDGFYYIHNMHGGEKKDYLMIGNSKSRDGCAAAAAGIDYFFVDSSQVNWEPVDE